MALSSAEAYIKLKGEATELLNDVGSSLASLLDAPASESHAEAHIDLTQQLGAFFGCYYKLRKRLERDCLSVAVLALTKSGKSTLINAFLANEILPVNNVPETARICRIKHVPTASCPEPVLELTASSVSGTGRSSSLVSGGSADFETSSSLGTSPSTDGGMAVGRANRSSSMESGECTEVLVGAASIREHLQQLNRDVRAREHLRNDEKILNISAPLVVLDSPPAASGGDEPDLSAIQLCLLDTPGPNEAGEEGLKYQVERLLGRVDAAIYLLDYTKLKTAEEAGVLSRLKAINPQLVSRLCSRLFFAVNKMDQADESCGLDDEETRAYVAEIVTQQLNCPDFKLHPDQVLLLSARDALLSRLVLSGRTDPANTQRFCRIAFGAYNPKPRGRNPPQNPNALPGAGGRGIEELRTAAAGLLEGSGVPELEERVLGFLCEAAAGVKLMATLDDTGRLLAEVSNVSSSCRAALAASSQSLADKTATLQTQLDETLSHFDSIMEGTAELQVEVTDELRAHLGNLRTRLFQYIYNALDAEALRNHQAAAAAADDAAASAAAGQGASSSEGRRHNRGHGCCHSHHRRRHGGHSSSGSSQFQSQFQSFCSSGGFGFGGAAAAAAAGGFGAADVFTGCMPGSYFGSGSSGAGSSRRTGGSSGSNARGSSVPVFPGSSGSSGGGWWGLRQRFLNLFGRAGGSTESKDELSSALMDLSEELMAQIQAEVAEAWHVMEGATNERAARLTTSLNGHIQQLSAQLEGAVNEALQIQLEPVSLRLAAPDAVQFHADLTDLIEKGIRHEQTRHVRTGERTDFVMEARRGACRLTQYYVQVPRRRRIIETYTATTYTLAPEAVLDHFMGVVDEAISTTEAHLPGYVKEYIRRQVDQARAKVQQYGNRYIDSLSAALEAASAGAEARQSALDQVTGYCDAFDSLRARLTALQAKAELLVPHNTASGCGLFEQVYEDDEAEQQQQEQQDATAAAVAVEEENNSAAAAAAVATDGQANRSVGGVVQSDSDSESLPDLLDTREDAIGDILAAVVAADNAAAAAAVAAATEPPAAAAAAPEAAQPAVPTATAEVTSALAAETAEVPTAAAAAESGADAVAAMGSSSFFAASFDALASWMSASNIRSTAAAGSSSRAAEQAGERAVETGDIAGAAPAATAAAGDVDVSQADTETDTEDAECMPGLLDVADGSVSVAPADVSMLAAAPAAAAGGGFGGVPADAADSNDGEVDLPDLLDVVDGNVTITPDINIDGVSDGDAVQEVVDLTEDSDSEDGGDEIQQLIQMAQGGVIAQGQVGGLAANAHALPSEYAAHGGAAGAGGEGEMAKLLDHGDEPSAAAAGAVADDTDGNGVVALPLLSPVAAAEASAAPTEPACAEAVALAPALATAGSADSSSSSTVSNAETAVSDSFSLLSGAATESSAFSGMTAGTAFTLQSSGSSGISRHQEHLADSVLGGLRASTAPAADTAAAGEYACSSSRGDTAVADSDAPVAAAGEDEGMVTVTEAEGEGTDGCSAAAAAPDAGDAAGVTPVGSESLYASMYGSGLLLSADDVAGALQMSALPAATTAAAAETPSALPAVNITSSSSSTTANAAAPAGATPTAAAAAAAEPWQGDASLYASIIAHSEDHDQPGSPFNFGESFAAALSAAGLDSLSGPSPPSGSPRESGSDDWQIVEADVAGGAVAAEQPAAALAAAAGSSSSKGSRSWLGGRAK